MTPTRKRIVAAGLALLFALQFVRPAENLGPVSAADDLIVKTAPPPEVARILESACYDCHSDRTRYPWYAEIEPLGWWLADHIDEGRKQANFSRFATLPPKKQADMLDKAVDALNHDTMPILSYRLVHAEARLTVGQKGLLTAWLQTAADAVATEPRPKG